MSYSVTTSIVCASLAGIAALVVIIVWLRRSLFRKPESLVAKEPESSDSGETPEVSPVVVQAAVPATVPASQTFQEPQLQVVEQAAVPEPTPDEDLDQPLTSQEIVSYLKELPPIQADAAKESFRGSSVEWTLFYSSMMLKGSNQIEVTLLNADNAYPGVSFLVDLDRYSELRGIKWGAPVTVRGVISSVYSMYIILKDVELSFPDSAAAPAEEKPASG